MHSAPSPGGDRTARRRTYKGLTKFVTRARVGNDPGLSRSSPMLVRVPSGPEEVLMASNPPIPGESPMDDPVPTPVDPIPPTPTDPTIPGDVPLPGTQPNPTMRIR